MLECRLFVISPLGEIVFTYNKCSIYYKELNVLPGNKDGVVTWIHPSTNFKVGLLICFDINYPNSVFPSIAFDFYIDNLTAFLFLMIIQVKLVIVIIL